MSKYGNSYSGNNFEEWYKKHYGTEYNGTSTDLTKQNGMSDEDIAIGKQLLENYLNKSKIETDFKTSEDTLLNNYNSAKSELNENKRLAQQNASITYDKLKKYLPQQLKAQGLGGLGVSESALLQAYNTYNGAMGNISAQHSKNISDLEREYGENKAALESKKQDMLYNADRDANGNLLVDNVINKYAEAQEAEQEMLYNTSVLPHFLSEIEAKTDVDGKISEKGYAELEKFVNDNKDKIGEKYGTMLNIELKNLEPYKSLTSAVEITLNGNANTANGNKGDNFEIQYNGTPYKVEKGHNASKEINEELSNAYKERHNNNEPEIGSAMIYNDKIYMYLHNNVNGGDTWSIIQGRALNQDSFINLCNALQISSYGRNKK